MTTYTPVVGLNCQTPPYGGNVTAIPSNPNGGFIINPLSATDQGLAVAEVLYVDPINNAGLVAFGTTFALQPGQRWDLIPGQTSATSVNALSASHRFSAVYW